MTAIEMEYYELSTFYRYDQFQTPTAVPNSSPTSIDGHANVCALRV